MYYRVMHLMYIEMHRYVSSDGSGSNIFDPGQVGSAIYGLGLNLENFP